MKIIKSGFAKMTKIMKNKVALVSVACFCASFLLTAAVTKTVRSFSNRKGAGGFETSSVPEYTENLDLLLSEGQTDSPENSPSAQAGETSTITYQTYRVKQGDMIGYIADKYNISTDTIISINNIKQSRLIQVGQYLKIPSMKGIIYTVRKDGETPLTIAAKYEVDAAQTASVNSLFPDSELKAGTSLFVPEAELDWMTRQEINGDLFHKPLHGRYWISSRYGWRDSPFNSGRRSFHGGLDMATASGTPIYAALDGRVTTTGFNATYGNYVIITHHSGYKTLYGHMSQITCQKGNFVYTNTMIGRVGSTGMSTGPHLHFTVYKNGKSLNPSLVLN